MDSVISILYWVALVYVGLAITKVILMYEALFFAAKALRKLDGYTHSQMFYVVAFAIVIPFVAFFRVIPALYGEKFRFFAAYTPLRVMRELVSSRKA